MSRLYPTLGKDVIDVRDHACRPALCGLRRAQLLDTAVGKGHATVRAKRLDDVEIVVLDRKERVLVRRANVVALEEPLRDQLPVRGDLLLGRADEPHVRAEQVGQLAQGLVWSLGLVLGDEQDAAAFAGLDRNQTMSALVKARETVRVRNGAQGAVGTVGPGVVAAGEGLLAAGAAGNGDAAMTARIAEDAGNAVAAADGEQRRSRRVAGDVAAGSVQRRRRAERGRRPPQHAVDLGFEAFGTRVVGDRLLPDAVAEIGGPAVDVVEDARNDGAVIGQGVSHDHPPS